MTALPKGGTAVMSRRVEPPDSLDFFPTGPWATRALCEVILRAHERDLFRTYTSWDPAAGEGHMAEVLREYFGYVHASDVFDYGKGYAVGSFTGEGPDVAQWKGPSSTSEWTVLGEGPDWIITNPPFNKGEEFALRALQTARRGVALLVRSVWALEAECRYESIFKPFPPAIIAPFIERCPMHRGRWEPDGSTTTSYTWVVWRLPILARDPILKWIPPGQRQRLERPDDRRRFGAPPEPMSLFPEAAE